MSIRHGFRGEIVHAHTPGQLCSTAYARALEAQMDRCGEHHGHGHARWRDVAIELQQLPAFAVVRNPWARTVSRWLFNEQAVRQGKGGGLAGYRSLTFREFLEERHRWIDVPFFWHRAIRGWHQQKDYVTDQYGRQRCDILRTEHLDEDVTRLLGKPPPRRRNVTTQPQNYRGVYDKETREIVADWYGDDIDYFGFSFEGPATRRILP